MTFENVAAVFPQGKILAQLIGSEHLWRTPRMYAMSINGRAIKTGGYASMPDENRREAKRANLYPPLQPPCLRFPPSPPANCVSACQLFFSLHVGITFHNVCTLYVFNLSTREADMFFVARENKHEDLAERK